ncbi:hypothetical protein BY458DRAFT_456201 [Sporodiniella umbellata]|nr:hypothetical protein BY458DRAFT_456201 [Sporodiniella umbellata]
MLNKTKPQRIHPQLPALNITLPVRPESFNNTTEANPTLFFEKSIVRPSLIEAAQGILFSAQTLKRAIHRCLVQTQNDNLQAAFSSILQKTTSAAEKLAQRLDSSPDQQLIPLTTHCLVALKELCLTLSTRLSVFVQTLDPKHSRHLLVSLYSTTIDTKEAWETLRPHLTINPLETLPNKPKLSQLHQSPTEDDNNQIYTFLKNAITGSFHVLSPLRQSIAQAQGTHLSESLQFKLQELSRQADHVTELSQRLDTSVENRLTSKQDGSSRQSSKTFWEETSVYLKGMVGLMTLIRSISKEEQFVWPRMVKQGCLYVTRVTAEVARQWNESSTFAQEGFFLGKK